MLYIEDNFLMVNEMDSELWYIEKIEYMKGSGLKIIEKEKEWKNIVMEINMKEILKEARLMVKVFTIGLMEKYMMVSGKME
jgi:hypothetical protein